MLFSYPVAANMKLFQYRSQASRSGSKWKLEVFVRENVRQKHKGDGPVKTGQVDTHASQALRNC